MQIYAEPIKHGNPKNDVSLGELLAMRGKPFKDWKEERKYLQEKVGKARSANRHKKGGELRILSGHPTKINSL